MTVINSFRDDFSFLSNFHPSVIYVDGLKYASVEHAYQAAKATSDEHRELIRLAPTPGKAKQLGKLVPLRPDWEDVKVSVMRDLVRKKFENPFLRPLLLATEDATLVEGNYWHDRFWGVDHKTGEGQNWLGRILMEIRQEIKDEETRVH